VNVRGLPEMIPVESSSVAAVGYDQDRSELFVRYVSGGTYAYSLVPARMYRELLASESKGRYVNTRIKPNHAVRQWD
jgi:lysyl-tRNA synthetase class 2